MAVLRVSDVAQRPRLCARLRNGLASQKGSASRAARAHRRSHALTPPAISAQGANRATERQRPAPGNHPQPAPNSQGSATAAAIRLRRHL